MKLPSIRALLIALAKPRSIPWPLQRLSTRPRIVQSSASMSKPPKLSSPLTSMSSTASLPMARVLADAPGCE